MRTGVKRGLICLLFGIGALTAVYAVEVVDAEPSVPGLSEPPPAQAYVAGEGSAQQQPDLVNKFNRLEQELQSLRGELEVTQHELKELQSQSKAYYDDLSDRLSHGNTAAAAPLPQKTVSAKPASAKPVSLPASTPTKAPAASAEPVQEPVAAPMDATLTDLSSAEDAMAYQKAYNLYQTKKYPNAKDAFKNFLTSYPNSPYCPNVHYWLGELALVEGRDKDAEKAFNQVVHDFPDSNKVGESLFKLGQIEYDAGRFDQAKTRFTQVKQGYPGTAVGQLATSKLDEMAREGV